LNGLNALNELNAPNNTNRDVFFLEREKASCFPKTYFMRPFKYKLLRLSRSTLREGEGPVPPSQPKGPTFAHFPRLFSKEAASISFVFEIESHVWSKRKMNGFVPHKRFLENVAKTIPSRGKATSPANVLRFGILSLRFVCNLELGIWNFPLTVHC
jgi:hypothetical protein